MSITAEEMIQRAADIDADGHPLQEPEAIRKLLEDHRFKPGIEPPQLRAIYRLNDQIICTPGNLTAITAAIKTGKSTVIGAMAASAMAGDNAGDLLGFSSRNPEEFALLHFDSEQSPDDHWHQVARTLKRAGLDAPPPWFYSYWLTGLSQNRAWECVKGGIRLAVEEHGGIHSILIDGVADLVADVNDSGASNAFVAELHDMAIRNECPIVGVIHFNPGSEKSRGHLGSQLERKAETNLILEKDANEITVMYSTKNRRAGIPKKPWAVLSF